MKVTGFSFICNAVKNDYPIVEAITSVLPICDEFIVAVGDSEDETLSLIENINSPKIKIIHTVWDHSIREGGRTFAIETDKAYAAISKDTDWAIYIQGDECIHEKYLPVIQKAMEENLNIPQVEGLLLKYLHFYGSYDYTASSRRWYRNEIRVLKFSHGVQSYRDAQGFRKNGQKIKVKPIDAYVYHYGWVKPPAGLGNKVRNFNKFYHDESWIQERLPDTYEFDYGNADRLVKFTETHPQVMQKRIEAGNWQFSNDPTALKNKMTLRRRLLQKLEDLTGWRLGEYKNYKLL
ncbi:glycosyltransferase family protein [Daejeonella oryzae]|uniref:glycosyl transferase n=1 Tax=Daejeonella oryzae TaxID=1122943 RepID=UPI000426DE8E|nr:glycosyl transferase [Daejeonella oryzae]